MYIDMTRKFLILAEAEEFEAGEGEVGISVFVMWRVDNWDMLIAVDRMREEREGSKL